MVLPHNLLLDAGLVLLILIAVFVAPVVFVVMRARWLTRMGSTFDCSIRLDHSTPGAGWALGVARYAGEEVQWFRYYSVQTTPKVRLGRATATVVEIRDADPLEAVALYSGHRIVRVECFGDLWDLAMSAESMTGLLAWLESAPPGQAARPLTSPDSAA